MPLTALPARIRRVIRDCEFARVSNGSVLVQRPAANDGFASVREGFFDSAADAQVLLNELATQLIADRRREAIETDSPFQLGAGVDLTPAIPTARCIDKSNGFDRVMTIKGVAIDLGTDRNSIEVVG